ncbi:S41 family peptidase [Nannocystis radixulma]|uniref:Tail specific protease domain-containing protein n=1 Tax=Nannocystis radixulma TaxID=2995305 RepID=A0ABT5BPB7_9BACT|nr:hypothetical protein [Nannocystis radixulma]MDC0675374.1 hypothetical protein [Nannocystis radixulma]
MPTSRTIRLFLFTGALGVFACDDTCPEVPVPLASIDATCGPTAIGTVPVVNGSFEALQDPLAGWSLRDAPGTQVSRLAGLDGCAAIALAPAGERFAPTAQLTQVVPAAAVRGQRVRLNAYVRAEASGGSRPGLAVHARVGERQRVVDGAAIRIKDATWALRGVEFDVPRDADTIELAVQLGEAARVELDGVTLDRVGPACPGCDPPASLDERELDNLLAYTRLLGHVRWFYPADQVEHGDWNRLALAGVQTALAADSPVALADALERAFQPRAPLVRVAVGQPPAAPFARPTDATRALVWRHGDNSERVDRDSLAGHVPEDISVPEPGVPHAIPLTRGLVASMPYAVWAAASSLPLPGRSDPPLAKPPGFTPAAGDRLTRLAAIAMLGARLSQFSPYVTRDHNAWEHVLRDSFARAAVARDRFELREVVWRLFAVLGDTPAQVHIDNDVELAHRLALRWTWLEDQVVVTAVDPARAPDLRVGDIVLALDGVPVDLALRDVLAYTPGRTDERRMLWALARLTCGQTDEPRALTVRRDDGEHTVAVATVPARIEPALRPGPKIRDLAPGLLYVDLWELAPADLRAAAERLAAADAAILDTRGTLRRKLVELLVPPAPLPERHAIWPEGQHAWSDPDAVPTAPPEPMKLPSRLVVLTDAGAIHYTEPMLHALRTDHGARLVGSPTAGATADLRTFKLPGGLVVYYTHGEPFAEGRDPFTPLAPDIAVTPTIAGIRAGRDEVLERALAELQTSEFPRSE